MVSVQIWLAAAGSDPRATAHNLLHTLTGDPALTHTPAGRPQVPGWSVSITHTHHLVAVAAARTGPVGVDLEELHARDFHPLASRWFTPQEVAWTTDLLRFLQLWTAKEAVGKALGLGLRQSGLRREMPVPTPTDQQVLQAGVVAGVAVVHVPVEGAVLALAGPTQLAEVVVHEMALRRVETSRTSFPVVVRGN